MSGNSTRVNVFDRTSFLERLSQAETVYGRVLGVDLPEGSCIWKAAAVLMMKDVRAAAR